MMQPILYDVPLIQQGLQECVQASAAQLLNFYGLRVTLDQLKAEVPVYVNKKGVPLGTSIGHMAAGFIVKGFETTLHVTDVQIFDQSWSGLSSPQIIDKLRHRRKFIKHPTYDDEAMDVIFDGYTLFLEQGGTVVFPVVDEKYLVYLLKQGPVYAVVNFAYLNQVSKFTFDRKTKKVVADDVSGVSGTHVVVVAGIREGEVYLVDPDILYGGKRWVQTSRFIAAHYLAETDFDNVMITLRGDT
jgi:hypothetical protein